MQGKSSSEGKREGKQNTQVGRRNLNICSEFLSFLFPPLRLPSSFIHGHRPGLSPQSQLRSGVTQAHSGPLMRTFGRLARSPFLGFDVSGVASLYSACGTVLTFSPEEELLVPKQELVENAAGEPPNPPTAPRNEAYWTTE